MRCKACFDLPKWFVNAKRPLRPSSPTPTPPPTGACGATGRTHDWSVSRKLVELSSRPVILAGGLMPDNVRQAIQQVRPAGVDAHTGVEGPDGRKDPAPIRRFVAEARAAFHALAP